MYCAIDIGGTKTLIALLSSSGKIKQSEKFKTPQDYDEFKRILAKRVAVFATHHLKRVVVAAPGRIDRKHGVVMAFGNLAWTNVPLQKDIEELLHTPVSVENDAKLAALGEAVQIIDTYKKVLYVTVSTGIGGGLIVNGKIDKKFEDMEVGQILLEHQGSLKKWEEFSSGKAFMEKFGKRVSDVDADDQEAWYWFARNISLGLLTLAATLTPEVIVIGGGAGAHLDKFQDRLQEQFKIYENPMYAIPPVIGAKNPEEAVIYGCYELAKQHAA